MNYTLYDYHDENGVFLYQTVKTHDPKTFRYRRWDSSKAQWIWSLEGVRRVLYNLEDVIASEYVFVVEGEKDVETLKAQGFVATTCPCGSNSWNEGYNQYFKDKLVYIIPDNDTAGIKFAKTVACGVYQYANMVKIIQITDNPKGDITDWFNDGNDASLLSEICFYQKPLLNDDIISFMKDLEKPKRTKPSVKIERNPLIVNEIEIARGYPIDNLLEVDMHSRAICISPDHEDKTPSMDVRNGFCYCYACGYHGDVINVAQKLWNCSFIDAVKILNILSTDGKSCQ